MFLYSIETLLLCDLSNFAAVAVADVITTCSFSSGALPTPTLPDTSKSPFASILPVNVELPVNVDIPVTFNFWVSVVPKTVIPVPTVLNFSLFSPQYNCTPNTSWWLAKIKFPPLGPLK